MTALKELMLLFVKQVRSNKLLTALGLKIQVTVDDTLAILKAWRAELTLSAR